MPFFVVPIPIPQPKAIELRVQTDPVGANVVLTYADKDSKRAARDLRGALPGGHSREHEFQALGGKGRLYPGSGPRPALRPQADPGRLLEPQSRDHHPEAAAAGRRSGAAGALAELDLIVSRY